MVSMPMIKDGMKIIRSSSFAENFNMLDRRACIKKPIEFQTTV